MTVRGVLPTLPGKVRGVVGVVSDERGRDLYTLQCENCFALETPSVLMLMKTYFHRAGEDRRRLCAECRAAIFADCECFDCHERRVRR